MPQDELRPTQQQQQQQQQQQSPEVAQQQNLNAAGIAALQALQQQQALGNENGGEPCKCGRHTTRSDACIVDSIDILA